jgi:hypothetical protein
MQMARLLQRLDDTALEPFLVTGGLYLFTALYYTRQLPLQVVSFIVLVVVALY